MTNSIQARVILFIVLIVTATSFLFAFALLQIKDRLEEATFGSMVREQMQLLLNNDQGDLQTSEDLLSGWKYYKGSSIQSLATEFSNLSPGSHHSILVNDRYFQVEVSDIGDERSILTFDITDWETQEHAVLELLRWGVGLVLLISIFIGLIASRASLQPLKSLSGRLAAIQPNERNLRISQDFKEREVGIIAAEFDRYLERLDEFVEREKFFTAAASHELRTPLSVVMGAVDVIDSDIIENPRAVRALDRIKRACREMLGFVETTLILSREDATFIESDGDCNVVDLVETLVSENLQRCKERNITIDLSLHPAVDLNPPHSVLKIVIGNLLRNAMEHTRDGKIQMRFEGTRFEIQDEGEGIDAKNLPRIFDANFTTKPGGTGMGLSLVKKICDRLGWNIEVESELGLGTKIVLEL